MLPDNWYLFILPGFYMWILCDADISYKLSFPIDYQIDVNTAFKQAFACAENTDPFPISQNRLEDCDQYCISGIDPYRFSREDRKSVV